MKKMLFTLVSMLTIAVSANAMSYEQARSEALLLTDKMAYELNLTDAQYEAAYEINLDYLMGVTSYNDVFGPYWERRNADLRYILYQWQWDLYYAANYFYRPLYWDAGYWHFRIYTYYPRRDYFYFGRPHFYDTYRGGHSWRHNGGRSYYESHHSHYRPDVHRDHHVGMRNGWDRGDYRHDAGRSSTRHPNDNHGYRDNNRGFDNGNRGFDNGNRGTGDRNYRNNNRGFDNNRGTGDRNYRDNNHSDRSDRGNSSNHDFGNRGNSTPRSGGSMNHGGSHSSGPRGGSMSGGSSGRGSIGGHSGGSHSGGGRSGGRR